MGHLSINSELQKLSIQVQEKKSDKDLDKEEGRPPELVPTKEILSPITSFVGPQSNSPLCPLSSHTQVTPFVRERQGHQKDLV